MTKKKKAEPIHVDLIANLLVREPEVWVSPSMFERLSGVNIWKNTKPCDLCKDCDCLEIGMDGKINCLVDKCRKT